MEELINKTNNLIDSIDNSALVKEIKELNKKIQKDKKLLHLLEEYKLTKKEDIKNQIMENSLFKEYKLKETDLNILIMSINQKLKSISGKRSCNKWK